jgi:hypothetical protein
MGEDRINFFLEKHFGIGLRWNGSGRYAFRVSLSILCFTCSLGIGKKRY